MVTLKRGRRPTTGSAAYCRLYRTRLHFRQGYLETSDPRIAWGMVGAVTLRFRSQHPGWDDGEQPALAADLESADEAVDTVPADALMS